MFMVADFWEDESPIVEPEIGRLRHHDRPRGKPVPKNVLFDMTPKPPGPGISRVIDEKSRKHFRPRHHPEILGMISQLGVIVRSRGSRTGEPKGSIHEG